MGNINNVWSFTITKQKLTTDEKIYRIIDNYYTGSQKHIDKWYNTRHNIVGVVPSKMNEAEKERMLEWLNVVLK